MRREPTSMATKTYRTWNEAVTETKKSQATMACAWFLEQGKLFPEEQILRHQGDMRGKEEPDERQQLRILQDLA
jgi:hypothetical protein